ncbi:hypothetical protein AVEN_49484-1, partial [Araneus ventricosus]
TCGANAEYRECGSACPPTCEDRGKKKICTLQCVSGCFCKKGFVKNNRGVCVKPQECEQIEDYTPQIDFYPEYLIMFDITKN